MRQLSSPDRLAVLRQAGLSAAADEAMDRFARLVASVLDVPVALVSLVEADRQVFPGMVGLAEPWASRRETPLSHSLCQYVAVSGNPLVLPDARQDELTCASLAIEELGVVAYAGMPLTDDQGHVLGSLCAIDSQPRTWSPQELANLNDLAAACSGELRLRIMSQRAQGHAARAALALERSELMLRAASDLVDTSGLIEVRRKLRNLVTGDLKPSYVGLALVDGQQLRRVPDPDVSYVTEVRTPSFPLDGPLPSARAVREQELVIISDRTELAGAGGEAAALEFDAAGLRAAVCVPLSGATEVLGVLALGWDAPHEVDVTEQAVLTAIAGYAARAVERALHLDERVSVARLLQQAMLTSIPAVPGVELAAIYRPAASGELVGGDWYDAYPLPQRAGDPDTGPDTLLPLALTVGDITGHDMEAAAVMGQVRSMLRQADLYDHLSPADAVIAVERACRGLSLEATGTVMHALLSPTAEPGSWQLTWTSAGHPPMLLASGGAPAEQLGGNDPLLYPDLPRNSRTQQQRLLGPGDTLLLYTDGLVERRGEHIDAGIGRITELLSAAPAGQPLPALLSQIADSAGAAPTDDVVMLAVRIPAMIPPVPG